MWRKPAPAICHKVPIVIVGADEAKGFQAGKQVAIDVERQYDSCCLVSHLALECAFIRPLAGLMLPSRCVEPLSKVGVGLASRQLNTKSGKRRVQ